MVPSHHGIYIVETVETVRNILILHSKITADCDCCQETKRRLLLGRKVMANIDSILKSRDITLPTKVHLWSQSYGFSSRHVWMWELDYKESWVPKNWCFWTVVLEKAFDSPLDSKEIKLVHPKGNQSWIFTERTDAEPETPIVWPPDEKNWLIWKDLEAGKDWWWEEKGMTEEEMLDSITDSMDMSLSNLGAGEGLGVLVCCSPWVRKELDTTE